MFQIQVIPRSRAASSPASTVSRDGTDLSDLRKSLGPLPIPDAVRYLLETCSAIGEAHAMGIIHRDLKPANLFLAQRREKAAIEPKIDSYNTMGAISTIGFIAGGALAATGVVLMLTAPRR